MAELKPAVNTNVLLPVSVSVRHHLSLHPPSLSLSLSLSLFSLRSLSLTSSEEAGGSQSSSTRTCYLCSGVTKDSQVDTTLSERVKLEAYPLHCEDCTVAQSPHGATPSMQLAVQTW